MRSGEELELELADFVIAASGRPVTITDEASVNATHSDGTSLVVDDDTLRFRSAEGYFGPASLSFIVTDGSSPDDPEARTGTIVIPIDVLSIENQPPSFVGGVIEFEPGRIEDHRPGQAHQVPISATLRTSSSTACCRPPPTDSRCRSTVTR